MKKNELKNNKQKNIISLLTSEIKINDFEQTLNKKHCIEQEQIKEKIRFFLVGEFLNDLKGIKIYFVINTILNYYLSELNNAKRIYLFREKVVEIVYEKYGIKISKRTVTRAMNVLKYTLGIQYRLVNRTDIVERKMFGTFVRANKLNHKEFQYEIIIDTKNVPGIFKKEFHISDIYSNTQLIFKPNIQLIFWNFLLKNSQNSTIVELLKENTKINIKNIKWWLLFLEFKIGKDFKFAFNGKILRPAYELSRLKTLYKRVINDLQEDNLSLQRKESLMNLKFNILRLNNYYEKYQQQYDDLINNKLLIVEDFSSSLNIYDYYNKTRTISSDPNEWDWDWIIIQTIWNNKTIKELYLDSASYLDEFFEFII